MSLDLHLDWDRPARTGSQPSSHTLRARVAPGAGLIVHGLPVRMSIALDVSGSMIGEKLVQAKHACEHVIALLRPEDRLSLAGFSTELVPIVEDLPGGPDASRMASRALHRLTAVGVTRADVALQWMEKSLASYTGMMRIGILITDGHPTDPLGKKGIDTKPLVEMARRMGQAGITVCAVGLGNAKSFNTALLAQISDRGHGAFIYSETPAGLEMALASRLSQSQSMAVADASLRLKPLMPGVIVRAACRFRPEYVPLDVPGMEVGSQRLAVGSVRSDTATDILLNVDVPAPTDSSPWPPGVLPVIEAALVGDGNAELASGRAFLTNTASYAEAQQRDDKIEQDRLSWEVNIYSDALIKASHETGLLGGDDGGMTNMRRTGQLLSGMEQSARRAGNAELADEVAAQIDHLRQTGRLDAHRATGLLMASRSLGVEQDERETGDLLQR